GTENQQRLHQAWPSFSVFLKNCDSGNTYSFPFTLLFESSLSGQGLFAPDSCLQLSHSNGILLLKFSHSENKLKWESGTFVQLQRSARQQKTGQMVRASCRGVG